MKTISMSKKLIAMALVLVMLVPLFLTGCGQKQNEETQPKEPITYTEDNLELYEVPEWYRDAKFGIFIHYGVYSVPAFGDEWYGHWMYMPGTRSYGGSDIYNYHRRTYGGAAEFGYKDFIPSFLTELGKWDSNNMADQWAQLFSQAGAKYVVPVGMHHDSYALYASDVQTTYNSVTQAQIDYVGQLQAAVQKYDMKFGISNHFAENDWFFDDVSGVDTDMEDPAYAELYGVGGGKTEAHVRKWYAITMEIIEKYQPDLIYFDFDLVDAAFDRYPDANRYLMLSNYYNMAQTWEGNEGVVCNFKNGAYTQSEAVLNKEREALGQINPTPWQTDTSDGAKSWCYTTDEVYRKGEVFISALIDIVSKNGNLLLNVGPQADGTIPQKCVEALQTIGSWLDIYGDAIYATRPWLVYGEGVTQNSGDNYSYTGKDIRFTRSKDWTKLYISSLAAPANHEMVVKTLASGKWDASQVDKICLIQGEERIVLTWTQTDAGLEISIPENITTACSVEVTFKDGATIPTIALSASDTMQAGNFAASENMVLSTATEDGSDMIYNKNDGAWATYDLDFDSADTSFLASVSGNSEGTITIYEDSPKGTKLAEVTVSKGSSADYRKITAQLPSLSGRHTLCLVFRGSIELNWFKMSKEKAINSIIQAEDFDAKFGSVQAENCPDQGGGKNLGYVKSGDYVMYAGVNFGNNCTKLYMRLAGSGQSCQVRIDSVDGPIIAKTGAINTGGWTIYKTFTYNISGVSGIHDVYITYDTGWSDLNVNWFAFSDGSFTPDSAQTEPNTTDSSTKKLGIQVGAEFFDDQQGTVKAEACAEGGQNLGWVTPGDWVMYSDFDFGSGAKTVSMRLSGLGGKIELRLDSPDGTLLASFSPNTGDWANYETFTAALKQGVSGKHDIYIVFVGMANVNWFCFTEE